MAGGFPVDRARNLAELQNRFQLGGERDSGSRLRVVHRLDAEPVAREEQLLPALVPDREAEHAAQPLDASRPQLLVEVDDRFGIARGAEDVALLLELVPELAIVVDLAVEHDPDGGVLVRHGLLAAGQVDDAQTAHAERHTVSEIDAFLVRSAMDHDAAHIPDLLFEDRPSVPPHDSGDTAHVTVSLRSRHSPVDTTACAGVTSWRLKRPA